MVLYYEWYSTLPARDLTQNATKSLPWTCVNWALRWHKCCREKSPTDRTGLRCSGQALGHDVSTWLLLLLILTRGSSSWLWYQDASVWIRPGRSVSVKGQMVGRQRAWALWVTGLRTGHLASAITSQKQPGEIGKQGSMGMFQQNFIYKWDGQQAGLGSWTLCPSQ